jgi:hypothetical protein
LREERGFGDGFVWRVIFGRDLAAEALGLGLERQKSEDNFGLAIDAAEAVGEAEGAIPIDGG